MKVLIVGKTGQLARELVRAAPANAEVISLDRSALDLSSLPNIPDQVRCHEPSIVINAAAYTAVDLAEKETAVAYAINDAAVGALADACVQQRARFVHVSTDFVFDGAGGRPYSTDAPTNPVNVYGASKLAGERRVAVAAGDWRIIRTAWVYSSAGKNFVLTMLRLFREREVVQVVSDQVGTPTSAKSLARCVWQSAMDKGEAGIFHFTDAGVASWYDFAIAIYEEALALGLVTKSVRIVPIGSDQYPTAARRPSYSVLDTRSTLSRLQIEPIHWRAQLRDVLQELKA